MSTTAAPHFEAFLRSSFGDNPEMLGFIQRLCGLFLFANALPEPTVIIFKGPPASGKTTLINVVKDILGTLPSGGYSADLDGYHLTRPAKEGQFQDLRLARVIFSDAQNERLCTQAILSLLKAAPGAKLVIEANDDVEFDDAGLEVLVVPFQHDPTFKA